MNTVQIIGLVVLLYLAIALMILFSYPPAKEDIDKRVQGTLKTYIPRKKKRPYFSIHYFSSGWSEAKKSLPQFVLFVILSPLIFSAWVVWLIFGKEKPKDFKQSYPTPAGRPEGTGKAFPEQDKKSKRLILEQGMTPAEAFENLRTEYYPEDIWKTFNKAERDQVKDAHRKRMEYQINGE